MCHSVEMYLPKMTQRIVEQRIGEVDFAAAERGRQAVAASRGLWARLKDIWAKRPPVEAEA